MDEVAEAIEKYHGLVPLVYDIETMCLAEARPQDMYYAVYLKREADKVIAELEERIADGDKDFEMENHQNERLLKIVRHHKYKRCLAMADMCSEALCFWDNVKYTFFKGEAYCFRKMNHYGKWGQIWLVIAEKFKEAK